MRKSDLSGTQIRAEATLAGLASRQHGVVGRTQALEAGFTARMIRNRVQRGLWVAVHPGVYRLAGARATFEQRLMAACLTAGPDAVASHGSAARLWRLTDGPPVRRMGVGARRAAMDDEGSRPEVTVPGTSERLRAGVIVHRTRTLAPSDVGSVDGVPTTTATRTVLDLAGVLDAEGLEEVLDAALREGLTSVRHLQRRLAALGARGRAGAAPLQVLISQRSRTRPAESNPELRLARLLRKAGLPAPVRQHELWVEGVLVARFDLAYPDRRIAVEYDSYRHHFGRQAWRQDKGRHNRATANGWLVLHVTDDDVSAVVEAYTAADRSAASPA